MREVQVDDERGEYGQIEATERICEDDGCALVGDRSEMIQVGEAWYCPGHGQQLTSERWSDEELARELEQTAAFLEGMSTATGTETESEEGIEQLRAAARRLRGGEGERLRRVARKVARMRRSTSNSLAGGMSEALDELNEALGPVVTAERAEQVHEGHSAAVCPDCGRQEGDLHHPACPLADGDAPSPTDGEEGERMTIEEWMDWTPSMGADREGTARSEPGALPDPHDAAPDTEGRGGDVLFGVLVPMYSESASHHLEDPEYGRRTVCGRQAPSGEWSATGEEITLSDAEDRGSFCRTCIRVARSADALPEEAGGEWLRWLERIGDVATILTDLHPVEDERDAEKYADEVHDLTAAVRDELRDRLRGAPEAAGGGEAERRRLGEVVAYFEDATLGRRWEDGLAKVEVRLDVIRDTLRFLRRLRTGREERDDG